MVREPSDLTERRYQQACLIALAQQIPVGLLAALMLDFGQTARAFAVVFIAHWLGVLIILARRPRTPTEGDLLYIKWGFWLLLLVLTPMRLLVSGTQHAT